MILSLLTKEPRKDFRTLAPNTKSLTNHWQVRLASLRTFAKVYACVAAQRATFATTNHYPARTPISCYLTTPCICVRISQSGTLRTATKL